MNMGRIITGICLSLLLLTACADASVAPASSDDSASVVDQSQTESSSPTPSTDRKAPSEQDFTAYFDGIASLKISDLEEAIELAAPGSLAEAYATYQKGLTQSAIDGGTPFQDTVSSVKEVDGGYEYCVTGATSQCFTNTEITAKDGKIASFSINGKPLKGRLQIGNGKATAVSGLDAKATFIAAYEATSGDTLVVIFSMKTGPSTSMSGIQGSYRSPEGRQSSAGMMNGPFELGRDSLANYALYFPNADLGGDITVSMWDQGSPTEGTVTLHTR